VRLNGVCAVAVMAKAPRPGHLKTRLQGLLTAEEAAQVGAAFLADVTANVRAAAEAAPVHGYVAYALAGQEARFDGVVAPGSRLVLADGALGEAPGVEGFGRSLLHTVRTLLDTGYGAACVLNADSPTLPTAWLAGAARHLLAPGRRAVIGPADGGGYWAVRPGRPRRGPLPPGAGRCGAGPGGPVQAAAGGAVPGAVAALGPAYAAGVRRRGRGGLRLLRRAGVAGAGLPAGLCVGGGSWQWRRCVPAAPWGRARACAVLGGTGLRRPGAARTADARPGHRAAALANPALLQAMLARHPALFDWVAPDGGVVGYVRLRGSDGRGAEGVERFVLRMAEEAGVLLPAGVFRSDLVPLPPDRFRIGFGHAGVPPGLAAMEAALR